MKTYIWPIAGGQVALVAFNENGELLPSDCVPAADFVRALLCGGGKFYTYNVSGWVQKLVPHLFQSPGFELKLVGEKILKISGDTFDIHCVEHLNLGEFSDLVDMARKVEKFHSSFGDKSNTISGVAFAELRKKEKIAAPCAGERYDAKWRPYYFAGRCEARVLGVVDEPLTLIDINSAFPAAMTHKHPWGGMYEFRDEMPAEKKNWGPCFVDLKCTKANGAFPRRVLLENGETEVIFPTGGGEFRVTGWEVAAAVDCGLVEGLEIISCAVPQTTRSFGVFVRKYYKAKQACKESGDLERCHWFKLILNSAYGAFGQNPANFKDVLVLEMGQMPASREWKMTFDDLENGLTYWTKKAVVSGGFRDVACAASITGFVRARLVRTIHAMGGKYLYCDTDSLLVPSDMVTKVKLGVKLGEWRADCEVRKAWIASKKCYALEKVGGDFKTASKGAELVADEIKKVAEGETVRWEKEGTSTAWHGQETRVVRTFKPTKLDKINERLRKKKKA